MEKLWAGRSTTEEQIYKAIKERDKKWNFTGSFNTIQNYFATLGAPILISRIVDLANHFYQLKG